MRTEAIVVGGGVIGLATAHCLSRRGVEVTLVERDRIGAGASSGNAGWLVPALSAPLAGPGMLRRAARELTVRDGALRLSPALALTVGPWLWRFAGHCNRADHLAGMRATAALAAHGLDGYDELADAGVRFTMNRAGLVSAFLSAEAARRAAAELAPLREFGYGEPEVLDAEHIHSVEPALSDAVEAGYLLYGERAVNPITLLRGLECDLRDRGVRILEGWPVTAWETAGAQVTAVRGPAGRIRTERVVVAAGAWSDRLLRPLGGRAWLQPGKGYSFSARPRRPVQRPVLFGEAKCGASPFTDRVRVVGHLDVTGLDERLSASRVRALRQVARRYLRDWPEEVLEPWCGLRSLTPDGLPVLSRLPGLDNVTVGAGHGLLGMTLAVASARLLTDLALGARPSVPGASAFSIDRFGGGRRRSGAARAPGRSEPQQVGVAAAAKAKEL